VVLQSKCCPSCLGATSSGTRLTYDEVLSVHFLSTKFLEIINFKVKALRKLVYGSVADPDPGSGVFLTPGSGMGKKSRSGSGMNILDHISESLETIFWVNIHKFFDADADLDPGIFLTQDPGWKKFGSGINIPDPQH
jgi:hypothetical protein